MGRETYELSPNAVATAAILILWVVGLIALGLVDLWLGLGKRATISDRVWDGNTLLGLLVTAWFLVGPVFLAGHFWLGWFRPQGA